MKKAVGDQEFSRILESFPVSLQKSRRIAVGVSGGPDSMALAWLLSRWAKSKGAELHVLTVDHGLRRESAKEARQVADIAAKWPNTKHSVLRWEGKKPKTRLMEAARSARYDLMADYCRMHKIKNLFLAHHQDDQAETFLFRLAKGSGLDGLSSIRPVQIYDRGLQLLRPLLGIPKQHLEATCKYNKVLFIKDPSNDSDRFARPRLRKARAVLEKEGLTAKRLGVTAARLERARSALDEITDKRFKRALLQFESRRIVLSLKTWRQAPVEIRFRMLVKAVKYLRAGRDYMPRMERLEDLFADLQGEKPFRKRTLGGLVFERDDKKGHIRLTFE